MNTKQFRTEDGVLVASYNLYYDTDGWVDRSTMVSRFLDHFQPDIVGLQEALPEHLDNLPMNSVSPEGAGESMMIAVPVLYSDDLTVDTTEFHIFEDYDESDYEWDHERAMFYVEFTDDVGVINTHLDHRSESDRERAAELLAEKKDEVDPSTVFVTMDGNFKPDETPFEVMDDDFAETKRESDSHLGPWKTNVDQREDLEKEIDYVWCNSGAKVEASGVHYNFDPERNGTPSDHLPVYAEVNPRGTDSFKGKSMTETKQLNFSTLDAEIVTRDVEGKDEKEELIKVPISSDSTDRDGDEISEQGLKSIVAQIQETGTPIFGNHGMDSAGMFGMGRYDWKDIIATAKDAEVTDDNVVLAYLNPNSAHYDGEGDLLVEYIEEEQAVGFSIGFKPTKKEEKSSGEGNYVYHDLDLMETSAVGIPSNPDGMATAKSIQDELGVSEEEAEQLMKVAQLLSSDMPVKEADMEDEDKTIDDVLERLDALESTVETRFSELEAELREEDDEDEEDEEEENSNDEEDEEEDEDEKSYTKDEVDELEAKVAELRDALDDDEVESSETKVHGEADADNDGSEEGGWF